MNDEYQCIFCKAPVCDIDMICDPCIDDSIPMAENDYEDRYYREGRYAQ